MRKSIPVSRMTDRPTALTALFAALTVLTASPAHAQSLTQRMDALLDRPPFQSALWGVAVVDERGQMVYSRNADRMFVPASNTKLVVTTVAAALLPPDFTVKTSLYGTGPVVDGALQGDLVLYGRGDPAFGVRCYAIDTTSANACDRDPANQFRELVEGLKTRGIHSITGAVVGDGSYFEPQILHPGWDIFDTYWWYAAPVTGLALNDNSVDIHWEPGETVGAPAKISLWPEYHGLRFENRTRTAPRGGVTDVDNRMWRTPGTFDAWAEGTVALGHRGGTDYFAMWDPNLFAAHGLRAILAEHGIAVGGETRSTTDSLAYAAARRSAPLAEVSSRPLKDWIFPILNTSQNLYAEMLLKQVGRQFGGEGSWEAGIDVEQRFLIDSMGVDSMQFSLRDGSGLAADNLMSPLAFTKILRYIRQHPNYPAWAAGLPRSGQRGSLRSRFIGTALEGKVSAKTGSISRVHALSGYVDRGNGRYWTFSVMANHHAQRGSVVLARIDEIVKLVAGE